jgi:hypothetical protein
MTSTSHIIDLSISVTPRRKSLACLLLQGHSVKPQRCWLYQKQIYIRRKKWKRVVLFANSLRIAVTSHNTLKTHFSSVCEDSWNFILLYCQIHHFQNCQFNLVQLDLHGCSVCVSYWQFSNFCWKKDKSTDWSFWQFFYSSIVLQYMRSCKI